MKIILIVLALFTTPLFCTGANVQVNVNGASFNIGDTVRVTIESFENEEKTFWVKHKREDWWIDPTCSSYQVTIPAGSTKAFEFGLTKSNIEKCGGASDGYYVKVNIDDLDNVLGYKLSEKFTITFNEWEQSCSSCSPDCGVDR